MLEPQFTFNLIRDIYTILGIVFVGASLLMLLARVIGSKPY